MPTYQQENPIQIKKKNVRVSLFVLSTVLLSESTHENLCKNQESNMNWLIWFKIESTPRNILDTTNISVIFIFTVKLTNSSYKN